MTSVSPPCLSSRLRAQLKKLLFFILKLAMTAGIIIWLLHGQDLEMFEKLLSVPWFIFAAVIFLQLFQHLIGSWRWLYLLRLQNIAISFRESVTLTWQSFFYSLVMPGGTLGGDLVKVTILCTRIPKGQRLEPASTIFIDRVIGMLGLFMMILFLSPLVWIHADAISPGGWTLILILLPACLAGVLAGMGMFFHREIERITIFGQLIHWLDGHSKGNLGRLLDAFDIYRASLGKLMLWALGSMLLIHIPAIMIVWVWMKGLNLSAPFLETLFAAGAGNTAGVLPSMGGFGFREATTNTLLQDLAGLSPELALLPVFGYAAVVFIFCLVGGLFVLFPDKNSMSVLFPVSEK